MHIQVRYFAVFRERLAREVETIELPDGATVAAALEVLVARHEPIALLAGRFQTAVNQTMAPGPTILQDGDELALIPPVAGGGSAGASRHVRVGDQPLSLHDCIAAIKGSGSGGLVTFTGIVRNHSRGRDVIRLEYEAYVDMAVAVLVRLCDEIEAEYPGCRLAVEHRIGSLQVGDAAVVIAAAAPHRREAFAACQAMIDRLKQEAPIWKKEVGPDGSQWVGLGP